MLSNNLPGYGDVATWGPIRSPRDPRHDDAEERAREAWEADTSFIDMLPESILNSIIELVRDRQFDAAHAELDQAMDAAWDAVCADQREAA